MTPLFHRHVRRLKGGTEYTFFCFWDPKKQLWFAHLLGSPQYVDAPSFDGVIRAADEIFDRMETLGERIRLVLEDDMRNGRIQSEAQMNRRCHALACIASQI